MQGEGATGHQLHIIPMYIYIPMSQLENTRKQSCHHANKLNSYATAGHFCAGDVATAVVIAQDLNKTLSKYLNSFFQ